MKLPAPALAVFDLDGTLIDSAADIAWCLDHALRALDLPGRGEAEVRQWLGNGAERLVKRALTGTLDGEPEPEVYERAYRRFMELYAEHGEERTRVYPGVFEGLEFLRGRGVPLGCVTNKPARFTEPLLASLGLEPFFGLVISGDTLARRKPDPLPLLHAAERHGAPPADCLMVGDSTNDVQAARAAGFRIACVRYGYNHGRDIAEERPDLLLDSLAEFASHF